MIALSNGRLRLQLVPEVGGGVARLDWWTDDGLVPLMRPRVEASGAPAHPGDPNHLACYPLVPWSNRIGGRGFTHAGCRVDLAPNRHDDPYPIHGTAWQRSWSVENHDAHMARMTLEDASPGGYAYHATLRYALSEDTLDVRLRVINTGSRALPFGIGLHPFFARRPGVRLRAPATGVWLNDGQSPMPTELASVPSCWDFGRSLPLPPGGLNHAFTGWTGDATIEWPTERLALHVAAEDHVYVLYVPEGEDFFCFEPVDHPIDAVHLPGGAVENGMTELARGTSMERRFLFRVDASGR
ncbi:aldose 1-epimerase [Luteibacter sp. PPL552]